MSHHCIMLGNHLHRCLCELQCSLAFCAEILRIFTTIMFGALKLQKMHIAFPTMSIQLMFDHFNTLRNSPCKWHVGCGVPNCKSKICTFVHTILHSFLIILPQFCRSFTQFGDLGPKKIPAACPHQRSGGFLRRGGCVMQIRTSGAQAPLDLCPVTAPRFTVVCSRPRWRLDFPRVACSCGGRGMQICEPSPGTVRPGTRRIRSPARDPRRAPEERGRGGDRPRPHDPIPLLRRPGVVSASSTPSRSRVLTTAFVATT